MTARAMTRRAVAAVMLVLALVCATVSIVEANEPSVASLQAELTDLKTQFAETAVRNYQIVHTLNMQIAALQVSCATGGAAVTSLQAETASLRSDLTATNAVVDAQAQTIAALTAQLSTTDSTLSQRITSVNQTLIAAFNSQVAIDSGLEQKIGTLNQTLAAALSTQVAIVNTEISDLDATLSKKITSLQAWNSTAIGQIASLASLTDSQATSLEHSIAVLLNGTAVNTVNTTISVVNTICSTRARNPSSYSQTLYESTCATFYCNTIDYGFGLINGRGSSYLVTAPYTSDTATWVQVACIR